MLAKTEERSKIFREIFHTEPYQKLQEALRTEAAQWKSTYESLSQKKYNSMLSRCSRDRNGRKPGGKLFVWKTVRCFPFWRKFCRKKPRIWRHFENKSRHCRLKGETLSRRIGKEEAAARVRQELSAAQAQLKSWMPTWEKLQREWDTAPGRRPPSSG